MRNVKTDSKIPTQTSTASYPPIFKRKRRQYSNAPATLSSQRLLQYRHADPVILGLGTRSCHSCRRVAFPLSTILKVRAMDLSQETHGFYWDLESAGADGVFGGLLHGTFWSQADHTRLT
jgi:hypothetical protein